MKTNWRFVVWGIVLFGVVLMLLMGVPWFVRMRTVTAQEACRRNLRQIDEAKAQWALRAPGVSNDLPLGNALLGQGK